MRNRMVLYPLPLFFLLLGCPATNLQSPLDSRSNLAKAAQALGDVATATQAGVKAVIQLQSTNQITVDEARAVLGVFEKVALAGKQADGIVRKLNALDPASRVTVSQIMAPVIKSLRDGVSRGLFNVKNAQSKSQIQVYIGALEAAFAVIDLALS